MVRTRTDAAALTAAGFVRLNGKRLTAAGHPVRVGDVVTLALDRSVRVVRVEGLCERRGAAPAARTLYRDLTTSSGTGACTPSANHLKVFAVSAAAGPALAVASRAVAAYLSLR